MIKFLLKVLIITMFTSLSGAKILAQSSSVDPESGAPYSLDDEFNESGPSGDESNLINPPEEPKYVSPTDFNNAIKTIEKYGMTNKQKRILKKKREGEATEEQEKTRISPFNPSPFALLRLPVTAVVDSNVIPAGYYLLEYKIVDKKEVVTLKQGNDVISNIPVTEVFEQKDPVKEAFTVIESVDDNEVKVELNTKYSKVKFSLPKYKQ